MRLHLADKVMVLENGQVKAFGSGRCLGQQRDAPWLPKEQQSSILKVSVLEHHPHYAMTALALAISICGSTSWSNRCKPRCVFVFRPLMFHWYCNRRNRPVFVMFSGQKSRNAMTITVRWKFSLRWAVRRCGRRSARGPGMNWVSNLACGCTRKLRAYRLPPDYSR
jgi:molybdate transport system ATP-binding protein